MNINLKFPDELNEKRKALKMTWRDVIEAGLKSKDQPSKLLPSDMEPHIKAAVQNLSTLWNLIKESQ